MKTKKKIKRVSTRGQSEAMFDRMTAKQILPYRI